MCAVSYGTVSCCGIVSTTAGDIPIVVPMTKAMYGRPALPSLHPRFSEKLMGMTDKKRNTMNLQSILEHYAMDTGLGRLTS